MVPLPFQLQVGTIVIIFAGFYGIQHHRLSDGRNIVRVEIKQVVFRIRISCPCGFNKDAAGRQIRVLRDRIGSFDQGPLALRHCGGSRHINSCPVSVLDTDVKAFAVRAFGIFHHSGNFDYLSRLDFSGEILFGAGRGSGSVCNLDRHGSAGFILCHRGDGAGILVGPVLRAVLKAAVENQIIGIYILLSDNGNIIQVEIHQVIFRILVSCPGCFYEYEDSGKIRILRNRIIGLNRVPLAFFNIHIPHRGIGAGVIICPILHGNIKLSGVGTCGIFHLGADMKLLSRLHFSRQILHGAGRRICFVIYQEAALSGRLILRGHFHGSRSVKRPHFPAVRTALKAAVDDQLGCLPCFRSVSYCILSRKSRCIRCPGSRRFCIFFII